MQVLHRIVRAARLLILQIFVQLFLDDMLHLRLNHHLQLMQRISQHRRTGTKSTSSPLPTPSLVKKDD